MSSRNLTRGSDISRFLGSVIPRSGACELLGSAVGDRGSTDGASREVSFIAAGARTHPPPGAHDGHEASATGPKTGNGYLLS